MVVIAENIPLAPRTTFRVGGEARYFAEIATEADLLEALAFAEGKALPIFALGGGSNLLVRDSGFAGLVLHLALRGAIEVEGDRVVVPAGVGWDELVLHVCQRGMSGMECLAGIPGLVGASPIQNIGAYGQEVSQTIHAVRAYDRVERQFVSLGKADCGFGYRQSIFNTVEPGRYLITQVTFAMDLDAAPLLTYSDLRAYFALWARRPTALEVYEAVRAIRGAKGMVLVEDSAPGVEDTRSAGSFFKNPVVPVVALGGIAEALGIAESAIPRYPASEDQVKLPAAWLLDQAGFHKSHVDGAAGISSRHSLALINRGGARYADLARLRDRIVRTVAERFQVTLEQEPVEP